MQKPAHKYVLSYGLMICTIAAFFYCYEFVLRIIPGILHTELSARFGHISAAVFGEITALYYLAYSPMQLPVGILMDRFGPRRLLTISCALCAIGSYLYAFNAHIFFIGLGRFMVGFGSSFAFVGVLTLSIMWLPKELFSLFAGLMTSMAMLGNIYAEMKITSVAAYMGLDMVLMTTILIGSVLTLLIFFVVRDNKNYMQAHHSSMRSFVIEVKQVICSYKVWLVGVIGACLYTSLSVFGELWGKTYLQQAHHLSRMQAANCMSMLFFAWAIAAPLTGYLSDKCKNRIVLIIFGAIGAAITSYLMLYVEGLSYTQLSILVFCYGIFSAVEITVFAMAKEISGAKLAGTVFAVTNMIVSLFGGVLQPTVGWILDHYGHRTFVHGQFIYTVADYQRALMILPLSMVFVVLLCFLVREPKKA